MKVNYIQCAYVLGIDKLSAKILLFPHTEKFDLSQPVSSQFEEAKKLKADDYVESRFLGKKFRHPSDLIDGKDMIEYTIMSIRKNPELIFQKVLNYVPVLRKGKLTGIYAPLRYILTERQLQELNTKIQERHIVFLKYNPR